MMQSMYTNNYSNVLMIQFQLVVSLGTDNDGGNDFVDLFAFGD